MFIVLRGQVEEQIVNNLVSSGTLLQDEIEEYYINLSGLDLRELMLALLESHNLVEACIAPANHYCIGEIGKN